MSEKKSGKGSTTRFSRELGEIGFSARYWEENYHEPHEMDGIINAPQHARYLKAFFDVEYIDINSVIDFGFGLGHLFEEVLREFMPYRAWGIEPSSYAFQKTKERLVKPVDSMKMTLKPWGLEAWARQVKPNSKWFDLGLCTSVFQYLTEEQLKKVLPVMSRQVKYLYFSVPTDIELKRQVEDVEFEDKFALRRSKKFYRDLLAPYFTIVGSRVLESRHHFSEDKSFFTDYLFREP